MDYKYETGKPVMYEFPVLTFDDEEKEQLDRLGIDNDNIDLELCKACFDLSKVVMFMPNQAEFMGQEISCTSFLLEGEKSINESHLVLCKYEYFKKIMEEVGFEIKKVKHV